jgi:hypothetical protein
MRPLRRRRGPAAAGERVAGIGALVRPRNGSRSVDPGERRGDPRHVFDYLCEAGWPHSIVEVAREGFRRTTKCPVCRASVLCGARGTRVESDELPPEVMIGVPSWAMDIFSRAGRATFARFLNTDAPAARWTRGRVRPARRLALLGYIVFRVEGGLVNRRSGGRSQTSCAARPTSSARVPIVGTLPTTST